MSKVKFILIFFFLISVISVALAETNQSTTIDEGVKKDEGDITLRVTILSLILVAISFLLSHYMGDHDGYARRLRKLQYYCMRCKTSGELCNYMHSIKNDKKDKEINDKKDKEFLEDCIRFSITLMHFGPISFTLIVCFLVATSIATSLVIEFIPFCELSITNSNLLIFLIIFVLDFILLAQLWLYSRQGNRIAHWITGLQKIKFEDCCDTEYLKKIIIHPRRIEKKITKIRLWFARVNKDNYLNLITDIAFIIWVFILGCSIYFFCFCG